MPTRREKEFRQGFEIGAVVGGVLILFLLTLLIPTNEFRAHLYFLLGSQAFLSLHFGLFAIIAVFGLGTLAALHAMSLSQIAGMLAAAAAHVVLLSVGAYQFIPELTAPTVKFAILAFALGISFALLRRVRHDIARENHSHASVTAS